MSITKDYLERLNTEVGIAPAGSQEELDCAHKLADEFAAQGLAPEIQDFTAPSLGKLPYGATLVAMFLGMLLVGLGNIVATIIGLVLVFGSIALLSMVRSGKDVFGKLGSRAHSQNVVGYREAEVEPELRNRPIVIVAHYDTARVDPLANPKIAVIKKYLASYSMYLMIAVAACTILQLFVFLPEAARRTFWIIGIIASLPLVIWGACIIASRFTPYTSGAVDNKSSVAAMLGVLDRVTQGKGGLKPAEAAEAAEEQADKAEQEPAEPEMRRVVEEVVGVRHGEQVIRELGILPETCSITYIEPEVRMVPVAKPAPKPVPAPVSEPADETRSFDVAADDEPEPQAAPADNVTPGDVDATRAAEPVVVPSDETRDLAVPEPTKDEDAPASDDEPAGATRPMEPVSAPCIDTEDVSETAPAANVQADMSQLEDGQNAEEGPLTETDHSGLFTMAPEDANDASEAPRATRPAPAAISDPDWGKSSYKPTRRQNVSNVARRAALFDLPDPKNSGIDALGAYAAPAQQQLPSRSQMAQRLADASQQATRVATAPARQQVQPTAPDDIEVLSAPAAPQPATPQTAKASGHRGLGFLGRKNKQQESMSEWLGVDDNYDAKTSGENIGSWDNFGNDSQGGHWKGGAALNVNLRKLKDKLPSVPGRGSSDDAESEQPVEQQTQASDVAPASGQQADQSYDLSSYEGVEAPAPSEFVASANNRDLRDAILAMGDDDLKTHDIWFVATGASNLCNAGAAEFVAAHRKALRGAIVINLDCVGAGDLTMLTQEGYGTPRRSDRRFGNVLQSVADDLHMALGQAARPWANSDATMFMRRHLRSVTIMGMGPGESRACAGTADDVSECVNPERVEDVAALVLEAIRRS